MKLVTFQSIEALKFLNDNSYLICDDSHTPNDKYSSSYKFIIDNMNKNVNNNDNIKYPIWCWVKCYDGICPPVVKGKRVEGFDVKITFNKNEKDVFITDYRRYSFLLKNLYISDSIEDKLKFDKKLEENNISLEDLKAFVRKDIYNSHRTDKEFLDICKEIEKSFSKCITTDSDVLQGCIWKINKEDIESIEILPKDDNVYGSLNYVREDGKRFDWVNDFYNRLKEQRN